MKEVPSQRTRPEIDFYQQDMLVWLHSFCWWPPDKMRRLFNHWYMTIYRLVIQCGGYKMPAPMAVELMVEVLTFSCTDKVPLLSIYIVPSWRCGEANLIQTFETSKTHSSAPNSNKATGLCPLVYFPLPHFITPVLGVEIGTCAHQWIQIESIGASLPFSSQHVDLKWQSRVISMHILG